MIRKGYAIVDGWFVVPYSGRDLSTVHIGFGVDPHIGWHPAFLDYHEGQRVAKIRVARVPAAQRVPAWLRIDGIPAKIGTVT